MERMKDMVGITRFIIKKAQYWKDSKQIHETQDFDLTQQSRAIKYGYGFQKHTVVTEDKYILEVHQVFRKDISPDAPVIFLQHGMFSSSEMWTRNGSISPAYLLAEKGFNVFMGNNRGNKYGRIHQTLDPDKNAQNFFDFSFYELGKYDATAMVDYVLTETC